MGKIFIRSLLFLLISLKITSISFGNNLYNAGNDQKLTVVVIDAGHGGKDPGAVVANAREKDIVLNIALKLGKLIKAGFTEVKVIYTRDRDVFIPLNERALIANRNNAQLFISIHANWIGAKSVKGVETFTLGLHRSAENLEVAKKENSVILLEEDYETTYEGFDPNQAESYIMFENIQEAYSEQSITFASEIQDQFRKKANRYDRSVKQAGFLVLRQAAMPSVLIETGFISNDVERKYLLSESGKTELSQAIYEAFRNYKMKFDQRSSFYILSEKTDQNPKSNDSALNMTETRVTATNENVISEKQIPKLKTEPVNTNRDENKTKPSQPETVVKEQNPNQLYFSVQVGALSKPLEIIPSNFKGEKEVFEIRIAPYYKYYCGKFDSFEEANSSRIKLDKKFKGAFVVAIQNGEVTPVRKALK